MSDEQKGSNFKGRMPKVDMDKMKEKGSKLVAMIKRFIVLIMVLAAAAGGFFVGARMHELGHLNGVMGKDLSGATVTINGVCSQDGADRTLAEDQVKVSHMDGGKLYGIIRKTRESVECDVKKVAVDTLPLLSNIGKSPIAIPEIKEVEHKNMEVPQYKLLQNKVLLVSGSCRSQIDAKELAPFTDERIDVTSVESSKEKDQDGVFVISGIRRSDKLALVCSSKAIKYTITDGQEPVAVEPVKVPVTFMNKRIVVTSRCIPDPRIPAPRGPDGRKVSFFRLVNSPVQVIEEAIKDDKLVKFTGTIVDKKIPEAFGQMVVCDSSTYPMTYAPYDEDESTLDRVDAQQKNKEATTGSQMMMEDESKVDTKKGSALPKGRMPVKPAAKKADAPAAAAKKVEPKAESKEEVAAPAAPAPKAQEQGASAAQEEQTAPAATPEVSPDQSKEDLLKQLDGGETNGK